MKITDYAILFFGIFCVFFAIYKIEDNINFKSEFCNEEINRIADNVVCTALDTGWDGTLNRDKIVNSFLENMSIVVYGNSCDENIKKIWNNIVCMVVVDTDHYYLITDYENSEDDICYEMINMEHSQKVAEMEDTINLCIEEFGYKTIFPKNQGDYNMQTIGDKGLLVVYSTGDCEFNGRIYSRCILSGAFVKNS